MLGLTPHSCALVLSVGRTRQGSDSHTPAAGSLNGHVAEQAGVIIAMHVHPGLKGGLQPVPGGKNLSSTKFPRVPQIGFLTVMMEKGQLCLMDPVKNFVAMFRYGVNMSDCVEGGGGGGG